MNFNDLYKKISALDSTQVLTEDGHSQVEECGPMPSMVGMPSGMPGTQQPDSVSMNVSMNASGKGGIRDLLNVLQNLEDVASHAPSAVEIPHDGAIEIDGPAHDVEIDKGPFGDEEPHGQDDLEIIDANDEGPHADEPAVSPEKKIKAAVAAVSGDNEMDEAAKFANQPDVKHQSIAYMTTSLAGGPNQPHKQHQIPGQPVGTNPMRESLVSQLKDMYEQVKLRESRNVAEVLDTPEKQAAYREKAKASVPALNQQYSDARRKAGRDHTPGGEEGLRKHGDQAQLAKADAIKNKILKRRDLEEGVLDHFNKTDDQRRKEEAEDKRRKNDLKFVKNVNRRSNVPQHEKDTAARIEKRLKGQ